LPDFLILQTKTGQNTPNDHKMIQLAIKYPNQPLNISNGHKVYQNVQFQGPPKYTQNRIFGMKIHIPSGKPGSYG
jgi:hypothetical protein